LKPCNSSELQGLCFLHSEIVLTPSFGLCIKAFRKKYVFPGLPFHTYSLQSAKNSFLIVGSCSIQDHELRQVWKEATVMNPWMCYRVPGYHFFTVQQHSNFTHLSLVT